MIHILKFVILVLLLGGASDDDDDDYHNKMIRMIRIVLVITLSINHGSLLLSLSLSVCVDLIFALTDYLFLALSIFVPLFFSFSFRLSLIIFLLSVNTFSLSVSLSLVLSILASPYLPFASSLHSLSSSMLPGVNMECTEQEKKVWKGGETRALELFRVRILHEEEVSLGDVSQRS